MYAGKSKSKSASGFLDSTYTNFSSIRVSNSEILLIIFTVMFPHPQLQSGAVDEHVQGPQDTCHSNQVKGHRGEDLSTLAGGHVQLLPL